ncbi:hypothetical protein B484DRAFT_452694 [Ochromonadaceae sp. CCMP2298]|nr:hypothetical protein B484DRAFT_452694 [Ochromonadaceae sp. CCMP2298]
MRDPRCERAFTQAVALTLGYVAPSDVLLQGAWPLRRLLRNLMTNPIEVSAGAVSATTPRNLQESVTGAEPNVTVVSYTILTTAEDMGFVSGEAAFADMSAKLVEAVESSECERNLRDRAAILSVPLLLDVVCGAVTAELGEVSDSDRVDLTSVIVGYSVVIAALCMVCLGVYCALILPKTTVKLTANDIVDELAAQNCEEKTDSTVYTEHTVSQEQEAKSDVDLASCGSNPTLSRDSLVFHL